MQNDHTSEIFGNGVPTEPDVKKLRDHFSELKEGAIILFDDLMAVLGLSREHARFRTVVNTWRKTLYKESNVILGPVRSVGFKVLSSDDRAYFSASGVKSGLRKVMRNASIADTTNRESASPEAVRILDHFGRLGGAIRLTAATEAKKLKYLTPAKNPAVVNSGANRNDLQQTIT